MATITLNRPDKYNAIDRTMAAELLAAFRRVRDEAGPDRCRARGRRACVLHRRGPHADRFEERFAEIVANIAGKNAGALQMGKEVLARSLETPSLDAALAIERNAVQRLTHAPEIQAALAAFRQDPDALVRSQRAANSGTHQGA